MHIWVDADACPKPIKEILFRAATRTGIMVTLIANQMLVVPRLAIWSSPATSRTSRRISCP
jgi:uncharacterized protein YaiI (UPF0178 family)